MVHRMLAFAVQFVQVAASDIQITYSQQDEPGPVPMRGSHLEGKDCLQLSVRQIALAPSGDRKHCFHGMASIWMSAAHGMASMILLPFRSLLE